MYHCSATQPHYLCFVGRLNLCYFNIVSEFLKSAGLSHRTVAFLAMHKLFCRFRPISIIIWEPMPDLIELIVFGKIPDMSDIPCGYTISTLEDFCVALRTALLLSKSFVQHKAYDY